MFMAKASEADIDMAYSLCAALQTLGDFWHPTVPEAAAQASEGQDPEVGISESFDRDDADQCRRVMNYLLDLAEKGSLFRVVGVCSTVLNPRNNCVHPDRPHLELHPLTKEAMQAKAARPISEWSQGEGDVLWWSFPVNEAPWCGQPGDSDWPGHHTHWTPLIVPAAPAASTRAAQDATSSVPA